MRYLFQKKTAFWRNNFVKFEKNSVLTIYLFRYGFNDSGSGGKIRCER